MNAIMKICSAILLLNLGSALVFGQAGVLDPDFGTNGVFIMNAGQSPAPPTEFMDMAVDEEGRIIAVGRAGSNLSPIFGSISQPRAARLLADGTLDPSFGTGGVVSALPGINGGSDLVAVRPLSDGRILTYGNFAGGALGTWPVATPGLFMLDGSGALDLDYGFDGSSIPFSSSAFRSARSLAIDLNGDALIGASYAQPLVRKVLSDGTWEGSYVTNYNFVPSAEFYGSLVQPDGKLVLFGYRRTDGAYNRLVVGRLMPDGQRDLSFGTTGNGLVSLDVTPNHDMAFSCALDEEGNLYLLNPGPVIVKLLPDGNLDQSFGTAGILDLEPITGSWPFASAEDFESAFFNAIGEPVWWDRMDVMTMDDQGRLVLALARYPIAGATDPHRVLRLMPDGTPDVSFGLNGVAELALPSTFTQFNRVVTTPERILIAGSFQQGSANSRIDAAVVAVRASGTTGIQGLLGGELVPCHPQPAMPGGILNIALEPRPYMSADLVDLNGRSVQQWSGLDRTSTRSDMISVELPAMLPAGLYLVRISTLDGPLPVITKVVVLDGPSN